MKIGLPDAEAHQDNPDDKPAEDADGNESLECHGRPQWYRRGKGKTYAEKRLSEMGSVP